jgi:3-phytase
LLVVVERDGHKAQIVTLPDFKSILTFGTEELKRPYGAAIQKVAHAKYEIFITDNYMDLEFSPKHNTMKYKKVPEDSKLGKRVHSYAVHINNANHVIGKAEIVAKFGATSGPGVLHIVESIMIDEPHNRLLIADEYFKDFNIKIYNLDTKQFSGQLIGHDFKFENDPEGFVLYQCPNDPKQGFYIFTDQLSDLTKFHIVKRSNLEYIGTFTGKETKKTDGVTLTQKQIGKYNQGIFLAVHDDSKVSAFSVSDIMKTFQLNCL